MEDIKNQNKIKWYRNDCSIYSIWEILETQFPVIMTYSRIEKMAEIAFVDKILMLAWAVFDTIYKYMANKISKEIWLYIVAKTSSIKDNSFDMSLDLWYAYGIGLIIGNNSYLDAVWRGVLNKGDIDSIKAEWRSWSHNNILYKRGKQIYIWEVARGVNVKTTLDVLRYGIEQWVFWSTARTFVWWNPFSRSVLMYLMDMKHRPDKEMVTHNQADINALNRASSINKKYKFDILYK